MKAGTSHPYGTVVSFDGGGLDCGNGLLLLIRKHIDPLEPGQLLEILSSERSVKEDLPAWCRLTGNELVSQIELSNQVSFLVSKGRFAPPDSGSIAAVGVVGQTKPPAPITQPIMEVVIPESLPEPALPPVWDRFR